MILEKFVMLLAPTSRSKAYLQCMCKNNIYPEKIFIMTNDTEKISNRTDSGNETSIGYFDMDEPLLETIQKNKLVYEIIKTEDVNSDEVYELLISTNYEYIIYSGYGGAILKPRLFNIGKKIIHVHAGKLPQYRGSTTAYYSMLDYGKISATAMFMNERLDDGNIIYTMDFNIPDDGVNIDYIFEPYTRATVLVNCLKNYIENGCFKIQEQNGYEAETYYIIHPILKHIALLKVNY